MSKQQLVKILKTAETGNEMLRLLDQLSSVTETETDSDE
jgi:hypothetical protein